MSISLEEANRLRERILQARTMRAEGADPAAIAEVEPTREEIKNVVMGLRSSRTAVTPRAASSKSKAASLDDLLDMEI